MKKVLIIIIAFLSFFSFSSCKKENEKSEYEIYWENIRNLEDFSNKYMEAHPNGYDLGLNWCKYNSTKTTNLKNDFEVQTTIAYVLVDFETNSFNGKSRMFSINTWLKTKENNNEIITTIEKKYKDQKYYEKIEKETTISNIKNYETNYKGNSNHLPTYIDVIFPFLDTIFDLSNMDNNLTVSRCDNVITILKVEKDELGIKTSTYEYYFDDEFNLKKVSLTVTMTYYDDSNLNSYSLTSTFEFCKGKSVEIKNSDDYQTVTVEKVILE